MNRFQSWPSDDDTNQPWRESNSAESSRNNGLGTIRTDKGCGSAEISQPHHFGSEFPAESPGEFLRSQTRRIFLPLSYTASYAYPLLIWLHNDGFNENQIDQVMPAISLRNFVGVGIRASRASDPSGHRFRWHDSPAAIGVAHDSVVEAIGSVTADYGIRPDRIVLAGYGSGGTMAIRIAMRQPRLFAGAVSVGGHMPTGSIKDYNELRRQKLPMLWQWAKGNPDYTSESLNRDCQTAMTIGSRVEIRQYPGDDEMDTVVLSDLNRWAMNLILSSGQTSNDSDRSHPVGYSAN